MVTKNEKVNWAKGAFRAYCRSNPVVEKEHTNAEELSPSDTVIDALASAAEVDPIDLPPLFEFVDSDSIDMLVSGYEGDSNPPPYLTFKIEKWAIFVRADGKIRVFDITETSDPTPLVGQTTA